MVQLPEASKKGRAGAMGARQIYEALKDQIVRGVYGSNGLLPSSRGLAAELSVSRTTVTAAYEQLAAEGFVDLRQGARPRAMPAALGQLSAKRFQRQHSSGHLSSYGERLKSIPPRPRSLPRSLITDFRYGDLAPSDFPVLAWKRAVVAVVTQRRDRLAYDDPRGSLRLRTALQGYLWRARTLRCNLDQIIVVNGSQQGLDLCARLLLEAGDRFVIENPCYAMARNIFSATGAKPISIAVDKDGMNTNLLTGGEARLAYVTPSHQFPLGGVMPIGRRHQLLAWARRANAYVIEDDYDSEYRYDISPVPPLHGLEDSGNVIYLGTVSKTLSPTLRIGYLVVPPQLQDVFATAKQLVDRHTPLSEQEALATMLESGIYESHVRKIRRRNNERRETLLNALHYKFGDGIDVVGADAGLHIVAWLRELPRSMTGELIEKALKIGIGVHSVMPLYDPAVSEGQPDYVGLVMGYAALDTRQIERGVHLLRQAVDQMRK
ncbi:PLP-dependent aminotransferase family protein [Mesorhizobium caraganae]|uniref:MocR-like pyridoxine biosynthesis transcription factor PdxR n=1 Tax=Mesorhizobium caraganae TaxID=483206 RepID=UPI0017842AFC|nr:PLP-dependent aminotransferase family protein [Mesorhizobium caraganae]MBM2712896.1 PLP-dependent aminotransferase family protein [Mesorhizobium caraganae]